MNRFRQKLIVVFLVVFALSSFYSCAHKEPVDIIDTEAEIWEVQWTGDTEGKHKMMLKREKIEKDIFLADFAGPADMGEMSVYVQGTMKGTISRSQGFGTWSLTHQAGSSVGEWTIKIIKPCQ